VVITLVTFVHVVICIFLISVVLLQQGKGADMGAAFGGGSQTLFGASGADNLLSRLTTGAAIAFMMTSVYLASVKRDVGFTGSNLFKEGPSEQAAQTEVLQTTPEAKAPGTTAENESSGGSAAGNAASPATESAPGDQAAPEAPTASPTAASDAPKAAMPASSAPAIPPPQ
jgi:preprotein translocase subunit SecG